MKSFDKLGRARIGLSENSTSRCQVKPNPKTVMFAQVPRGCNTTEGVFLHVSHFGARLILSQAGRRLGLRTGINLLVWAHTEQSLSTQWIQGQRCGCQGHGAARNVEVALCHHTPLSRKRSEL